MGAGVARRLTEIAADTSGAAADAEPTDEALAVQLQRGDGDAAFTALVERYQRVVLNLAYRMLGDADQAQDVAQDVFVKVYQSIGQYDPERRFFSWLYRIAVNACLHERRRPATTALDAQPLADRAPSPAERFEQREAQAELQAALAALPERERTLLALRYGAELSYAEIATTLDVPLGTAKTWLFRAKQRLAELMTRGAA